MIGDYRIIYNCCDWSIAMQAESAKEAAQSHFGELGAAYVIHFTGYWIVQDINGKTVGIIEKL